MKSNFIRTVVAPFFAAMIWGTAFVAQSVGADYLPPFAFNALRSVVAVAALSVILAISNGLKKRSNVPQPKQDKKALLWGGLCCGTAVAVATGFQQMGLGETDAGKAGFITALYIVMVPIAGLFFHRKASPLTAISVAIAVGGLYMLCVGEGFTVQGSDAYLMLCALCFTVQILCIDHFAPKTDPIALSLMQFAVMAVESAILSLILEKPTLAGVQDSWFAIVYVGVFSSGIAYTLQIVAQKDSDPTMVSLIMSMESVFSAIAGAILLHEVMSGKEYAGCALMLCAVILSQIPVRWFTQRFKKIR